MTQCQTDFCNKLGIMFINLYRPFLAMTVRIWYITSAVSVDKSNMGLTFVPWDISIQVENLNLEYNRIIRITNMSFIQFIQLHTLKLSVNDLTYIENGSFDYNAKLETLSATGNNIMQLSHWFGAAAASLTNLHLWCALRDPAINNMNFTEMINLDWLNIGCSNLHGGFDASRLPRNLKNVCLNYGGLTKFPDFARHTPNIATIMTTGNATTEVPSEYIIGNTTLKQLTLNRNRLSTIPDLYHLPLTSLALNENPIVCNQSLCWLLPWGACYWIRYTGNLGNINSRNILQHNLHLVGRAMFYICDIDNKWMDINRCWISTYIHTYLLVWFWCSGTGKRI